MIHCALLGPTEVTVDGAAAPSELLWAKNLGLLVYLACSPKRTRSRDHLVGLLWADKPEEKARRSLNQALHTIRHTAGREVFDTSQQQVKLLEGVVTLDTETFSARVGAGQWREAADLVLGKFMDGFVVQDASAFEDWLATERAAWVTRGVDALSRHAEALIDAGHAVEAIEVARRALDLDPHSERAVRVLMVALALADDRSGALQVFAEFTDRLRDALGVTPSPELQALVARVHQERQWQASAPAAPAEREGRRRLPLVGRETALSQLLGVWSDCRKRSLGSLAIITGAPGVGKSRLVEELSKRLRLDGAVVTAIRAVEGDVARPWSGALGLARGGLLEAAGLAAAPPQALACFAADIPEWGDRFPGAAGSATSVDRALIECLRAGVAEQPIGLVVDDAQWLDRDTALCLGAALRDMASAPMFVLLVVPPQPAQAELEELRARIGRELSGTVVHLDALTSADIRTLATILLPGFSGVELDRLARRVAFDSAGLPLFVVELLHAVALGLTSTPWPEEGRTYDQTLPGDLPEAILGAVRVGFRRLSPEAQLVLQAAAVLGERVTVTLLARATQLADTALARTLDELEWERWLVAEPRGYSFVARIIRETVATDLTTSGQRQRLRAT